jgi:hypothetical protein
MQLHQLLIYTLLLPTVLHAQTKFADSTLSKSSFNQVLASVNQPKNNSALDISSGLKEALNKGIEKATQQLSATDGFFKNEAVKILMPPEAQKAEKTLRDMGFNKEVDEAILSMNRAAEDAAKTATPIFTDAIKQMNFQDAASILKGGNTAATNYLKEKTTVQLSEKFKPVIVQSLQKVDASKYWQSVFSTYNKIPFVKKVNTNLDEYVTEKTLAGLFTQLAIEEQKIRKDPTEQTTQLLKKIFSK